MGKTDTIKDRRVDVYLDTIQRKERWTHEAEDAEESLSAFVQQCVEYALEQGGPDFTDLAEESSRIKSSKTRFGASARTSKKNGSLSRSLNQS